MCLDGSDYTLLLHAQVLRCNLLICRYSSAWYPIIATHCSVLHASNRDEIPRTTNATLDMLTAFLALPLCVVGVVVAVPEAVGATIL